MIKNVKYVLVVGVAMTLNMVLSTGCQDKTDRDIFYIYKTESAKMVDSASVSLIDGIPFIDSQLWEPNKEKDSRGPSKVGEEVDTYLRSEIRDEWVSSEFNNLNIKAGELYVLGAINSLDKIHPPWGGGNHYRNFFMGNTAGNLVMNYRGGVTDTIPLIFGYNIGWSHNFKVSQEPFKSDEKAKQELDNALVVANALEGFNSDGQDYYIKIKLRKKELQSVSIIDNPKKIGYFRFDGLSFSRVSNVQDSTKFSIFNRKAKLNDSLKYVISTNENWLKTHYVDSENPYPENRQKAIALLREKYYAFTSDINYETIRNEATTFSEEKYTGPKVSFKGTPMAELISKIWFDNVNDLVSRIDINGMVHESAFEADRFDAFGGWTPKLGAYYTTSYTRLRGLTVLSQLGFTAEANRAISYFDKWLMYFPESYPDIQLGGKPVPGHATVIANQPHIYFEILKDLGWPTKFKTRDFGNPENDGHGLLMLTRWRAWQKLGKPVDWLKNRWKSINEAAEYIPWALNNPELSFSEHGLLHNESEGGLGKLSMYCDFACYMGLETYSEMAAKVKNTKKSKRWTSVADKMYNSINAYYPLQTEEWGDVWDPKKNAAFGYTHSTLAPLCIGMDYWGYDVANKLSEDWLNRTKRTYKMQLTKNAPKGAASAGIGYGQGYITQSALLLDKMADAHEMTEWMGKICFAPRLQHPFRVPEGSIISADGNTWRRWGDLGNLYQLVEVVHTINLMIGIDDFSSDELTIMPRIPKDWAETKVEKWPVRVVSKGRSALSKLSVTIEKEIKTGVHTIELKFEDQVDKARYRLGPFNSDVELINVSKNGKNVAVDLFESGDSKWAWIDISDSTDISIKVLEKL